MYTEKKKNSTTFFLNSQTSAQKAFSSSPFYPCLELPDITVLINELYIPYTLVSLETPYIPSLGKWNRKQSKMPCQQHDIPFLPASTEQYIYRKAR